MRILYISQYFPPEVGATQNRAFDMASYFVQLGHSVTILTEIPNHPSGIIPPEYRRKLFEKVTFNGIEVVRVWVKTSPQKNFRARMLFYLSFMINATIAGILLCKEHYDLIYATSPPLFVGAAAIALSWVKRTPMSFEVRDLWPESAIALGELNNRKAMALATRLEEKCYRRARSIIVVTRGIQNRLIERGIPCDKIFLIPNGTNTDLFQYNLEQRRQLRQHLGLENKFIVIYAGIFGIAQGLEVVLEAAQYLKPLPDVHILLIGNGPTHNKISDYATRLQLSNLTILPEQPRNVIPNYLSAADVAIIPLRKLELFKGALPSKLFDAWACQLPVVLNIDGEAHQLLDLAEGGVYIPPENPVEMARALIRLKEAPEERDRMGINGKNFTLQNYSRHAQAKQLINILVASVK